MDLPEVTQTRLQESLPPTHSAHFEIIVGSLKLDVSQIFFIYTHKSNPDRKLADLVSCSVTAQYIDAAQQPRTSPEQLVDISIKTGNHNSDSPLRNDIPDAIAELRRTGKYRIGNKTQSVPYPSLCQKCGVGCQIFPNKQYHREKGEK